MRFGDSQSKYIWQNRAPYAMAMNYSFYF